MSEVEQLQAELQRIQSIHNAVIEDMTRQVGRLTYEKSYQVAICQEKDAFISHLQKKIEELEESEKEKK